MKNYLSKTKKACLSKRQGSVLAYSLIILAVMVAVAGTLSVTTIMEKKNASSTDFSVQAYQTADSGVQLALKKMNVPANKNSRLGIIFGCNGDGKTATLNDAGVGLYALSFYSDAAGITQIDCSDFPSSVQNIKSIGTYQNTVRAVSVSVAINCPETVQDSDANEYAVVKIGTQCWMAENLRTTKKPDGTPLTEGSGMYSNPAGFGSPWGRLYDWATAMNISSTFNTTIYPYTAEGGLRAGLKIQGICPTGWHIPSDYNSNTGFPPSGTTEDFQKLAAFLGDYTVAGGKMKSTDSAYWTSPNTGAFNSSGFAGVAAGEWRPVSNFLARGSSADFWSSFQESGNSTDAWSRHLTNTNTTFGSGSSSSNKVNGYSVRCVKD